MMMFSETSLLRKSALKIGTPSRERKFHEYCATTWKRYELCTVCQYYSLTGSGMRNTARSSQQQLSSWL